MKITKCNLCGKINKKENGKWIHVIIWGIGSSDFDLCEKCSKGFLKFVKRYFKIKK